MDPVTIATGISLVTTLLSNGMDLFAKAQRINEINAKASAEGRTQYTEAEWAEIFALDDKAAGILQKAIDEAKATKVTKPV